ncbi:MAG TPA: ZIP family metal transporter [Patescibacteria group bacterium]|nr:ZIP family metal transporter [Patescibacteria group bacterium]
MIWVIIFFSLVGGLFSLIGGALLLLKRRLSHTTMLTLISFAAGVLLSVSFADLLPESLELFEEKGLDTSQLFLWPLLAIVGFFFFERSFVWFHHHHGPHEDQPAPIIPMVWMGDTLHNFVDGIVITASFLISIPLGITTSLAVAAHEIPQEFADFSLYLSKGVAKRKVLLLNILSSLATTVAAIFTFLFRESLDIIQPQLLAFTAGMFMYIACSDLIPELHHEYKKSSVWLQTVSFFLGLFLTAGLRILLE